MSMRSYHVIAIRQRDGVTTILTAHPEPHEAAKTILSKQVPRKSLRTQLWEMGCPLPKGCSLNSDDREMYCTAHLVFLCQACKPSKTVPEHFP